MNESTLKDSESLLIIYLRCTDKGHFAKEMLKRLESTTTSKDTYNKLKKAIKNITSCAADGALNMMGKKNSCLELMEDANPEVILVH